MADFPFVSTLCGVVFLSACAVPFTEIEPYREIACFGAAKVSLRDAVEAAEIEGGTAIDAAYRQVKEFGCLQRNAGYYDVTILLQGQLTLVSIDAASEQIQPRLKQGVDRELTGQYIERMFEGRPESRISVAEQIRLHLQDAIDIAEKNGGKSMEARVQSKDGKPGYMIKLVNQGKLRLAWVDGN
jgi:hypothetical protein